MLRQSGFGAWRPRLLEALQHYDARKAVADLTAGVTVGLVALPLAMAFAISSGLTPQAGIYTAIVAGGLISMLGGSRLQIGGPTGAFVVIVAGIVARHGIEGLFLCTLMAGVILIVLGATGMTQGRIYRMKLSPDGRSVVGANEEVFRTANRYRDIAIAPDGVTFYMATDPLGIGRTQDPSGAFTQDFANPGAIVEFKYVK